MKHHERSEIVALWGCNIIYALSTTQEMKAVLGKFGRPNTYFILSSAYLTLADRINFIFYLVLFSIFIFIIIYLFIYLFVFI